MTNEPSQYIDEEPPESESDLIWGLTKIGHAAGGKTAKEMGYLLKHTTLFNGAADFPQKLHRLKEGPAQLGPDGPRARLTTENNRP